MNWENTVAFYKFQFHKGAIRTFLAEEFQVTLVDYFNSIKVRLELLVRDSFSSGSTAFQFHKGAIRTQKADCYFNDYYISIP